MQAGYDYLILRGRLRRRTVRAAGFSLLLAGIFLLALGGVYYAYVIKAKSGLDELQASAGEQSTPAPVAVAPPPRDVPRLSASDIASIPVYPGDSISPEAWSDPLEYKPASLQERELLQGFTPLARDQVSLLPPVAAAVRIAIPAVGIDSTVNELSIVNLGDSRAYETPNNTVGHIPESSDAGEPGDAWFFGHTESPVLGEGSVFFNLQKVPELLRDGHDIYIITENGTERFLYRVTETRVVHESDLSLTDSGEGQIHLVSCVPRLVYDHRLIVDGELVAQD